jgi:glutamyl-tRNA synthetase
MPVLKVRAADLNELAQGAVFLFAQRPLALDEKAQSLLTADARGILANVIGASRGKRLDSTGSGGQPQGHGRGAGRGPGQDRPAASRKPDGQATSRNFRRAGSARQEEALARLNDHAA